MNAPSQTDELAREILRRQGNPSFGPFVLFLGDGCARAAGVPPLPQLARMASGLLGWNIPPDATDENVELDFLSQIESMKPAHVARMLQRLFATIPLPTFYQYLGQLVRGRFFPLILTTNYDTFLEQALSANGVHPHEYRVTTFGRHLMSSSTGGSPEHITHIVKLHGDIARDVVHLTADQVDHALNESRSFIKAEMRGDLIMVGYEMEDEIINGWLKHMPQRQLWWVSRQPPKDPNLLASWSADVKLIEGEEGRVPIFFSRLAPRLLQPGQFGLGGPDDAESQSLESIDLDFTPPRPVTSEEPLADTLQNEIKRAQGVLYSLEQNAPAELRPQSVQAQIAYQKKHVSSLEDRMRGLPDVKPRLLAVMAQIHDSVEKACAGGAYNIDPRLSQYLNREIDTIRLELENDEPNQFLVSASLGATLTLADRLCTEYGPEVVNPEHVRELASFAPMIAAKVVF
jgi:hypothetical protein